MGLRTDGRDVLRPVGRALRGLFGSRPDADEINPLNATIRSDDMNTGENGVIPVEVTFQSNPSYPAEPENVVVGVEVAFEGVDDAGGGAFVAITDPERVARPETVADFRNLHQHGKLMHRPIDGVVPPAEGGRSRSASGSFPTGPTIGSRRTNGTLIAC